MNKKDGALCRHESEVLCPWCRPPGQFLAFCQFFQILNPLKMARLEALACLFVLVPLVASQFLNPPQARQQFRVGEVQKIRYRTKLVNYTIALWQQAMAGGSADLGPVVVRESPPTWESLFPVRAETLN
jgi:hypothetical protein